VRLARGPGHDRHRPDHDIRGRVLLFNNYILQVYQYLIADVCRRKSWHVRRLYRAIGAVAAFAFNRWVFGYTETHVSWIYLGGAVLYASALRCWCGGSGRGSTRRLPEPGNARAVKFVRQYARECYTNTFYLKIFSVALFHWASWCRSRHSWCSMRQDPGPEYAPSLGVSVAEFGRIKAWTSCRRW